MRRPSGPAPEHIATRVLTRDKLIDATFSQVLAECASGAGFERGSKRDEWLVRFWRAGRVMRGLLMCRESPLVGLDHHPFPGDGIKEGFHWDVYPPIVPEKIRIFIDFDEADLSGTLELMCRFWNIRPEVDRQRSIQW